MKIVITGDIHGEFGYLNILINKKKPDIIIICGDVAYYWMDYIATNVIKPQNSKVYWIPGNHEQWYKIETLHGRRGLKPIEIEKNIYYCPIGSSLLINNKKILFVGGADSYDKNSRITHVTWFPQETLNYSDVEYILNNYNSVDIIISHTCPEEFILDIVDTYVYKVLDPTLKALSTILEYLNPNFWFFGHWHCSFEGIWKKTKWTALNYPPRTGWWTLMNI